ncbi:MAG: HIT domain-containing protein [Bacteroidota bacterium]|nr:HIT domain-containing protein [Bacteroidota bacterium]
MDYLDKNIYSHLTAKDRSDISFPARLLHQKGLLQGDVLDFGCGLGKDVETLQARGVNIVGYDKHYQPEIPAKRFDTILCNYVLNVLLPEEQSLVLMQLSRLLKPSGVAYIAVRRDVQYEGYRLHKLHQKHTYQCNVKLNYRSIFLNENCEIYAYQHINQLGPTDEPNCPFCAPSADVELIAESATAYAIADKYPVNNGHTLIIPKRHAPSYFELTFREQLACWFVVNFVKGILTDLYKPDGFNIGVNIGEVAGQTVHHVHIHLIPRYAGDVPEPRGGVRGVIPDKRDY